MPNKSSESDNIVICAEYIWIGGNGEFRSKMRCLRESHEVDVLENSTYPVWNYDGSSTNQADGTDSDVLLNPVHVWTNPFKIDAVDYNVIVLCETQYPDGSYPITSTRYQAVRIFNEDLSAKPLFGIEQEFYILVKDKLSKENNSHHTLGQYNGNTEPQGRYYCGVGGANVFGRDIVTDAFNKCIAMGLNVSGMNAEVGVGQWEIQVGPCEGIDAGDELLMLRYILHRVSESHGVEIVFDPKPLVGDWNGSGCHTNYSTVDMREGIVVSADQEAVALQKGIVRKSQTGYQCIIDAINKLAKNHSEHMTQYGKGNEARMTGKHETADYHQFTYGVADRSASVRIPRSVQNELKGYLEDRRPGSNMDPYIVTSKIFETTVLED